MDVSLSRFDHGRSAPSAFEDRRGRWPSPAASWRHNTVRVRPHPRRRESLQRRRDKRALIFDHRGFLMNAAARPAQMRRGR